MPDKRNGDAQQPNGMTQEAIDQEEALLGTLLYDANTVDEARLILGESAPQCFTREDRRDIWTAVTDLTAGSEPVDLLTVESRLAQMGKCQQPGTRDYLLLLVSSVASTANAGYYARTVLDAHRRRVAYGIANTACSQIYDPTVDAVSLISKFATMLSIIADNRAVVPVSARPLCDDYLERLREVRDDRIISTGFSVLDDPLGGGFFGGDLIILAARPGEGKSAIALQIAVQAARSVPVCFLSLEMSNRQLAQRVLSLTSGVFLGKLRSAQAARRMQERDWLAVEAAEVPTQLTVENASGMTAAEFQSRARLNRRRLGCELIVLDYLQLMAGSGDRREDNRNQELAAITRAMKRTSMDLDIPVLCLSQLSRDPAKQNRAPVLSDLRDSGAIEQDADTVLMLHAKERRNRDGAYDPLSTYEYDVRIEKQRQGPVMPVTMRFMPSLTAFLEPGTTGVDVGDQRVFGEEQGVL